MLHRAGRRWGGCIDGEGACPPEDCGGPGGYAELLATLADPRHPEHQEMRGWVGDPLPPFDQEAVDRRVRNAMGQVPESVRLLLGLLADGVNLTPGGRLPRVVVRAAQQQRPGWYPLGRPASIEEDLLAATRPPRGPPARRPAPCCPAWRSSPTSSGPRPPRWLLRAAERRPGP